MTAFSRRRTRIGSSRFVVTCAWYDVDRWRPDAPVLAFHSPVDEEVPYDDALVSVERLRRRGATIAVRTLPGFNHVDSDPGAAAGGPGRAMA